MGGGGGGGFEPLLKKRQTFAAIGSLSYQQLNSEKMNCWENGLSLR